MAILYGIEIECELSKKALAGIDIGPYHRGSYFIDGWNAERDGSLHTSKFKKDGNCVEFVSGAYNLKKMKKVINDFISHFEDIGPFNKTMNFNSSSGCHIHFSMNPQKSSWHSNVHYYNLLNIRKRIMEHMKNNYSKEKYELFCSHYYRHFAKKSKFKDREGNEKYVEWNFGSLANNTGIEWRGFHLVGTESYDDLRRRLFDALDIMESTILLKQEQMMFTLTKPKGIKLRESKSITTEVICDTVTTNKKEGVIIYV